MIKVVKVYINPEIFCTFALSFEFRLESQYLQCKPLLTFALLA